MTNLLIKPSSGNCNLSCKYCFYHDEMKHRVQNYHKNMDLSIVDAILDKLNDECTFVFQGGEPMLSSLAFYKEFVARQKSRNIKAYYYIQTNGTLIDDAWCQFFKENDFYVGISLDGYKKLHDMNRSASFDEVMKGIMLLKKHHIDFSILCVVNKYNVSYPKEIYEYFKSCGFNTLQFIPCIDSLKEASKHSIDSKEYGEFLIKLFDLWYEDILKGNNISIRYFENLVRILLGLGAESCGFGKCTIQNVIESNGDVYPCDFYCLDNYKLGNIKENSFEEISTCARALNFIKPFVNEKCKACNYYKLCKGGCKRDLDDSFCSKFCEGYKMFFNHSLEKLLALANKIVV